MAIDAITGGANIAASSAVAPAAATSDQQSAFQQALADAQLGVSTSSGDATTPTVEDTLHLQYLQAMTTCLTNAMADIDSNRKDDSDD